MDKSCVVWQKTVDKYYTFLYSDVYIIMMTMISRVWCSWN